MHLGPDIVLVVNAWDAASARVFDSGTYTRFHNDTVPYAEANRLFE